MSGFLHDALTYAARGWSIIPIRHRGDKGKQPALRSWSQYQTTRPNEGMLRRWFGGGRKLDGLAVVLGPASGGLTCRDFDEQGAYERWASAHPDLAGSLPTVRTGRGFHVYFRSDATRITCFDDGELRGAGYCLLPPSRHPSGAIYEWVVPLPDGELPFIDPIAAGLACGTERQRGQRHRGHGDTEAIGSGGGAGKAAAPECDADAIERAIRTTLPRKAGQRNRAVFALARALKAIPALADADTSALRDTVRRWHEQVLPVIDTKDFDETWADFTYAWPRVRFPAGTSPMETALKNADAATLPAGLANVYDSPVTHRLVKLCRELQRMSGADPFFLSSRTAGELLSVNHRTVWRRLGMLEADGVLSVVKRGTRGRATRFRCVDPVAAVGADSKAQRNADK